ncbi:MAG TPA: serine/threonine dehydratase, partial [Candidatus Binataceae bacterium]|nr:serine/threonine dehydratase [Candidatus Binataceae bacterium]
RAGSFKARGAFNNLLSEKIPPSGVIAASGGNHGVAVAFAAQRLGQVAEIFVPTISSPAKIERIRKCVARLTIVGANYAEALEASLARAKETGARIIHAYDQRATVEGAGTIAMEFEAQAGKLDSIIVPVGGGGLIGGVMAWFGRATKVIGVEPRLAPTMARALEADRPVDVEVSGIAADGLGARRIGEIAFELARASLDRMALVEDADIIAAQRFLWSELRIAAEPAGAAATAALLSGQYRPAASERVGVLVSGGNVDLNALAAAVAAK